MMRPLPPIYPITNADSDLSLAAQIARYGGAGMALVQFRGKPLDVKAQWEQLREALTTAHCNGGWPLICVNDRADLAVMAAAEGHRLWGLHLGQGDLPHAEARGLPGLGGLRLGASTHGPEEWGTLGAKVDHAGLGPFRATGTKPDHEAPTGLDGLAAGCAALRAKGVAPIAIGGLTVADAEACFRAGAESLAMIGEAARAADPAALGWAVQQARLRVRPFDFSRGVMLAGSSGAGKSTTGARLAERLGLPFHDLDKVVERAEGLPIAAIFARHGEAAFRDMEDRHLVPLLAQPSVIAMGGGAWEIDTVRAAVAASGFLALWLAEPPAVCWARVHADPARPLARDQEAFMDRHRARMRRWSELPSVSSFGRSPAELARAMTP
ncbi:MAG TPA: shikimate kinase [Holophagaceae bacterium]|jgi:thiamine-phosphate diphosphorylase|nr:shikimate kinase [Holophagaceae bacterium]